MYFDVTIRVRIIADSMDHAETLTIAEFEHSGADVFLVDSAVSEDQDD